eukprot:4422269-Heterocapsa_arctica.AAC.1
MVNFAPKNDLLESSPLGSINGSQFEIFQFRFVNVMLHVCAPESVRIVMNDMSDIVSSEFPTSS